MKRTPVILDVDTGVDDALAVMLALNSPELDVRAVTVCGGNHGLLPRVSRSAGMRAPRPLALALAVKPDFCVMEKHHVAIEAKGQFTSGATLAFTRPFHKSHKPAIPDTYVCTDVDAGRFERFFVKRVTGLENRAL